MKRAFSNKNAVSLDCFKTTTKQRKGTSTVFYCCGCVDISSNKRCMWLFPGSEGLAVEEGKEADENEKSYEYQTIKNPDVPYIGKIPDTLYLGRTISIWGKSNLVSNSFAINIMSEDEEDRSVFFHFNPRFDRRIVVRNHRNRDKWGEEEISNCCPFPFIPNQRFKITIYIADNSIMVAVNCRHYCSFTPRMAFDETCCLEIIGSVTIELIKYGISHFYPDLPPTRYPRLICPHWRDGPISVQRKCNSITPGSKVVIRGRVKLLPQTFYINLQSGATEVPHPVIPLHINLRLCQPGLHEKQMIYNAWVNGSWGEEMKLEDCPFEPGSKFMIVILYYETGFHVSVNDKFLVAFPMRLPYPPVLDTVHVHGDVFVSKIKVVSAANSMSNTSQSQPAASGVACSNNNTSQLEPAASENSQTLESTGAVAQIMGASGLS